MKEVDTVKVYCCDELDTFIKSLDEMYFSIGEGEISGSVELIKSSGVWSVSFNDGWNSYPDLKITFCPYCGIKQ